MGERTHAPITVHGPSSTVKYAEVEGHVHEIPLVQLVVGLGSGHWYVLVVLIKQFDGAGSSCGIVPLKELPLMYLRTTRGTTAGGEWERGKGWSGERGEENGGVQGLHASPTCHHPPRPLAPCLPTPRAGRRPSAAGSHVRQRGEAAELRGQATAQGCFDEGPCEREGRQLGGG